MEAMLATIERIISQMRNEGASDEEIAYTKRQLDALLAVGSKRLYGN